MSVVGSKLQGRYRLQSATSGRSETLCSRMVSSSLVTRRSWSFCASSLARHRLLSDEACMRRTPRIRR